MEKRIFISHSSKDSEVANQICAVLEENGLKCWIAPRDIPYGSAWAGEISKAIKNSCAFLFLSSFNSNASNQVSREIQLAIENELVIIPVHLDNSEYSDANKYYLATIHCMVEYNAAKVHKLASDIIELLPEQNEEEKAPEKKKEKKPKKEKHMRNMIIACICMVVCSLIGTYVYFFSGAGEAVRYIAAAVCILLGFVGVFADRREALKRYSVSRAKVNVITALSVVLSVVVFATGYYIDYTRWYSDMDTKYHITVSAPETMSASDFSAAADTVLERLDILAGDTRYTAKVNIDNIDIIVPRTLFAGADPATIMRIYISRAMRLYMTTTAFYVGEYKEDYPQQVRVTPEDIENLTVLDSLPEGITPPEDVKEGTEYIKITLAKDFADKNEKTFEAYGEKLVFALDKEELSNYGYFNIIRGAENNVFYLISDDMLENIEEAVIYNFTHEPLTESLNLLVDIAPVFEKAEGNEKAGLLQCDSKKLKGDTVTFTFKPAVSYTSEGEWSDVVSGLKARLDAIGVPYAFGAIEGNPLSAVIRTGTERMGLPVMRLLATRRLNLNASYTEKSLYSLVHSEIISVNEGEAPAIIMKTADATDKEEYDFMTNLSKSSDDKKLYLSTYDNMKFLAASSLPGEGEEIVFDQVVLGEIKKLDESTKWLADLAVAIYKNEYPVTVEIETYSFDGKDKTEADFGYSIGQEEIESKVREISPEGKAIVGEKQLTVQLNLTADEHLPEKLIESAKKLFEDTDFENSTFETLAVYAIEESGDERARIFFKKSFKGLYFASDKHNDGYIQAHGIFSGGRIQRDHDVFLELVYADEFIKQYIHEEGGYTAFE